MLNIHAFVENLATYLKYSSSVSVSCFLGYLTLKAYLQLIIEIEYHDTRQNLSFCCLFSIENPNPKN